MKEVTSRRRTRLSEVPEADPPYRLVSIILRFAGTRISDVRNCKSPVLIRAYVVPPFVKVTSPTTGPFLEYTAFTARISVATVVTDESPLSVKVSSLSNRSPSRYLRTTSPVSLAEVDTAVSWMLSGTVNVVGIPVDHTIVEPLPVTTLSPNVLKGELAVTAPLAMSAALFVLQRRSVQFATGLIVLAIRSPSL